MPRVTTTIELSFDLDLDVHEVAETVREVVELELGGVSVSTYDDAGTVWTIAGPGDRNFRLEGANLDDPIPSPGGDT